jgi:hypothetical protein
MPNGVAFSFQVCLYSIEPPVPNRFFNLFTKNNVRATLANEAEEGWPEVAFVGLGFLLARCREGLAGAGTSPYGACAIPAGEVEGKGPSPDSGEEVALSKSSKVGWLYFRDTAIINNPLWN